MPIFEAAINIEHRLIIPCRVSSFGCKEIPVALCPRARTITLMLDPPPTIRPIDKGTERPLILGFGRAWKLQSRSLPRFTGH
jgi:hypothetical protein